LNPERDLNQLARNLRHFAAARDWEKFHTPKNLSMALSKECAEIMELFQWLSPEESLHLDDNTRAAVGEEIADVLIYLTRLADVLGIDPLEAAFRKMDYNEQRFPATHPHRP
jgi:NTP pyrophosphatase (non-canonical NTP hydrolase)